MNYPQSFQKLISQFLKFPAVGPRTAARFVSHLTKQSKQETEDLIKAIEELKSKIKFCCLCYVPFESSDPENKLCLICSDKSRDKSLLCIVEKEIDLISIEKTKKYKGLYFILGGTIEKFTRLNSAEGNLTELRIKELKERVQQNEFKEIIIATNPTSEGEAAALIIEKEIKSALKEKAPKITKLGKGLPVGGELEYADEETLSSAFESRK